MSKMRVVCYESDVYHKPGCKYVARMKRKNRLEVTRDNAIRHNCRICRYCNSMNYHVNTEEKTLNHYKQDKGMDFKYDDGILYVKTEVGCWKLVYVRAEEKLTLFHFNKPINQIDWNHLEYEGYHHQDDVPYAENISKYLHYIYEHDSYKAAVQKGEKITQFSSKKNRNLAALSERKRERNRLDYIFRCLERENAGLKQVSYC